MAEVREAWSCVIHCKVVCIHSINPLVFPEIVGFGLLLVISFSIAVVVSTGRVYTCDRVTKGDQFKT